MKLIFQYLTQSRSILAKCKSMDFISICIMINGDGKENFPSPYVVKTNCYDQAYQSEPISIFQPKVSDYSIIALQLSTQAHMKSPRPCGAQLLWTWYLKRSFAPNELAAEIAVEIIRDFLKKQTSVKKVIFNVFKDLDKNIYEKLL